MTTTTTEPYEHGDPRIGSMVDADTWRAIPAPKIDDGDPLDRLGGYCIIAGDMPDEPDVWIEVTAEYPQAVAEFIVQAVRNEHGRQAKAERLREDNAWLERHYRQAQEADEAMHEKLSDALGLDEGVSWDALVDKVRVLREVAARDSRPLTDNERTFQDGA